MFFNPRTPTPPPPEERPIPAPDDEELRLECLRIAASTYSAIDVPNVIIAASRYFAYVKAGKQE